MDGLNPVEYVIEVGRGISLIPFLTLDMFTSDTISGAIMSFLEGIATVWIYTVFTNHAFTYGMFTVGSLIGVMYYMWFSVFYRMMSELRNDNPVHFLINMRSYLSLIVLIGLISASIYQYRSIN